MKTLFANSALVAFIGLSSLAYTHATAVAQDLELELGRDGPQLRLREDCDPDREYCNDRNGRRDFYDGPRRRDRDRPPFCTEDRALDKAERLGIRRARIDDTSRRTISVRGRDRYGDRVEITFGRAPNCPVLD